MCVFQRLLAMITPQPGSTNKQHMDMCCHLVIQLSLIDLARQLCACIVYYTCLTLID